jgi:uncharacterized repeat protein (TIGR01451 family)
MKMLSRMRTVVLLTLGLIFTVDRAEAQGFGLSATPSANAVAVSNSLTYTVLVTNLTGVAQTVTVSNILTGPFLLFSASVPGLGVIITNGNTVTFGFPMSSNGVSQLGMTLAPTRAGNLTNFVTVFGGDGSNTASARVVTLVTNVILSDLAVGMTLPAAPVFANDWMVYGVSVTNLGPNSATNVLVTNMLPAGVGYIGVSPAMTRIGAGSNVTFNLGILTNRAVKNLQLTVQPTNTGALPFVLVVSTNNVNDPNPANNSASNNLTVSAYPAGQLTAVTNSEQVYDSQDGLVEQSVLLSNIGTNAVVAARVIVTGLTNQQLYNAVGTNNGNPFVVYAAPLDTSQSANLLLQFSALSYFQVSNSSLSAVSVPMPDLTPPVAASGTNVNVSRCLKLTNGSPRIVGSVLLEWPSLTNRTYTVVYTSNLLSTTYVTNYVPDTNSPGVTNIVITTQSVFCTNWLKAVPSIVAPANRTQWIDYGPPATVSAPLNTTSRFYRVYLNP